MTSTRSATSTEFPESTKKRIRGGEEDSDRIKCVACGSMGGIEYCRVIAEKSRDDFDEWRHKGMLAFSSTSHEDNGIILCGRCHSEFDRTPIPNLYFIPMRLPWFIEHERVDYNSRAEFYRQTGERVRRKVPLGQTYHTFLENAGLSDDEKGPLYRVFLRKPIHDDRYHPPLGVGEQEPPVCWKGSPTALIQHALGIFQDPGSWIPQDVFEDLLLLARLYRRDEPWESVDPVGDEKDDRGQGSSGSGGADGSGPGGGLNMGGGSQQRFPQSKTQSMYEPQQQQQQQQPQLQRQHQHQHQQQGQPPQHGMVTQNQWGCRDSGDCYDRGRRLSHQGSNGNRPDAGGPCGGGTQQPPQGVNETQTTKDATMSRGNSHPPSMASASSCALSDRAPASPIDCIWTYGPKSSSTQKADEFIQAVKLGM